MVTPAPMSLQNAMSEAKIVCRNGHADLETLRLALWNLERERNDYFEVLDEEDPDWDIRPDRDPMLRQIEEEIAGLRSALVERIEPLAQQLSVANAPVTIPENIAISDDSEDDDTVVDILSDLAYYTIQALHPVPDPDLLDSPSRSSSAGCCRMLQESYLKFSSGTHRKFEDDVAAFSIPEKTLLWQGLWWLHTLQLNSPVPLSSERDLHAFSGMLDPNVVLAWCKSGGWKHIEEAKPFRKSLAGQVPVAICRETTPVGGGMSFEKKTGRKQRLQWYRALPWIFTFDSSGN